MTIDFYKKRIMEMYASYSDDKLRDMRDVALLDYNRAKKNLTDTGLSYHKDKMETASIRIDNIDMVLEYRENEANNYGNRPECDFNPIKS